MPKPQQKLFRVGDRVTWSSQAAGSWAKKVGMVIEVVAAMQRPQRLNHFGRRDHESYVVEVVPLAKKHGRSGKATQRKPVIYWPVASKLERAKGRASAA